MSTDIRPHGMAAGEHGAEPSAILVIMGVVSP